MFVRERRRGLGGEGGIVLYGELQAEAGLVPGIGEHLEAPGVARQADLLALGLIERMRFRVAAGDVPEAALPGQPALELADLFLQRGISPFLFGKDLQGLQGRRAGSSQAQKKAPSQVLVLAEKAGEFTGINSGCE